MMRTRRHHQTMCAQCARCNRKRTERHDHEKTPKGDPWGVARSRFRMRHVMGECELTMVRGVESDVKCAQGLQEMHSMTLEQSPFVPGQGSSSTGLHTCCICSGNPRCSGLKTLVAFCRRLMRTFSSMPSTLEPSSISCSHLRQTARQRNQGRAEQMERCSPCCFHRPFRSRLAK